MKFLGRALLILIGIFLPCLLLEAGVRIEHYIRKGTPLSLNPSSLWDAGLGWVGKEHIIENERSDHPVLILGDSFTNGLYLPTEEMWFSNLKEIQPQKIIAYGGMGYGTLQELLVLKKYKREGIEPSLIILQLCSNDIINNLYKLEKESYMQRAPAPRPYFEDGEIITRFPRHHAWLLEPLIGISRFAYRMNTKWETKSATLASKLEVYTVENDIARDGFTFAPFREAVSVTHRLLEDLKKESGNTPIYFILVDDLEPYTTALKTSAEKLGVPILIPRRMETFKEAEFHEDGAHFNQSGNKHLGKITRDFIQNRSSR